MKTRSVDKRQAEEHIPHTDSRPALQEVPMLLVRVRGQSFEALRFSEAHFPGVLQGVRRPAHLGQPHGRSRRAQERNTL